MKFYILSKKIHFNKIIGFRCNKHFLCLNWWICFLGCSKCLKKVLMSKCNIWMIGAFFAIYIWLKLLKLWVRLVKNNRIAKFCSMCLVSSIKLVKHICKFIIITTKSHFRYFLFWKDISSYWRFISINTTIT